MTDTPLYGGIEGGGTKFVCAVGTGPDTIENEIRFATTTPDETIRRTCDFFVPYLSRLRGIGLGSFGPFDTNPDSPTYGHITATPKPNWSNTNILGMIRKRLHVPVAVELDVGAAGLGEATWGAGKGVDPLLYLTIGTGIGGGYIVHGRALRGLVGLEMGHIRIPHDRARDPFDGACPFHGDCFEGLASGPAILARTGSRAETISESDPFWIVESDYISHALVNYILTLAPARIIVGGGVTKKSCLFGMIRSRVRELLSGYLQHPSLSGNLEEYIVPPKLGDRSGVLGGIAMAMNL